MCSTGTAKMLSFDIETEGLDSSTCRIVVACVYDPDRGIRRCFNFLADESKFESEKAEFVRCLDEADTLCSFNGVRFDIPFIAARQVVLRAWGAASFFTCNKNSICACQTADSEKNEKKKQIHM